MAVGEEVIITEPDDLPIAKRSYSGVFASAGIFATTFDAFARDIEYFVGIESTADYTADQHRTALTLIGSLTGRVASIENLLHDSRGGPLD